MISLLHTADLHLDWTFPSFPAERRALRRREVVGVFYQIIAEAVDRKVQALVIAGDLFQSQVPPQEVRSAVTAGFSRLGDHGIPVFLAPSPEEFQLRIFERLELPGNVCILGGDEPSVSNLLPGLTVYGFPIGKNRDFRPLQNFTRLEHPGIHLGILNGVYQDLPGNYGGEWAPIHREDVAHSGLDYLALGRYHEYFTANQGGTHMVYPGAPARLSFDLQSDRGVVLVNLGEGAPTIERLLLRDRPYHEFTFDLGETTFAEALSTLRGQADPEACLRVVFRGEVHEEIDFYAERTLEELAGSFFHLDAVDETTISCPAAGETIESILTQRFQAALAEPDLTPEERAVEMYAFRASLIALKGGRL